MRAVTVTAPGRLRVADVPAPDDTEGRLALVAIERAGICGTDVKIVDGTVPVDYPRVLGHEMVGVVRAPVARGVIGAGTRVLVNPSVWCGRCRLCRAGRENLCPDGALLGRDLDGGFADLVAVCESQLHPVPVHVPLELSVMLQVVGVCVHVHRMVDVFPDQTAAVVGLGVSGLLMVQLLRARGVERIVGITRSAAKRQLAERFGAVATATPADAAAVVGTVSAGHGADIVIECVGSVSTFAQAIDLAGLGATVVLFGTATADQAVFPFYDLYRKELDVRNPRAARPRDYDAAIELLANGVVRVDEMLSASYPLEQAPQAFADLGGSGLLKLTLEIS